MRYAFVLIALSLLPVLSLAKPGLPVTHDGPDHVARIANFYQSLSEGNIVPRWAENLNWGYGHPVIMFLYPLPSYAASLFHAIGFSFVDATKLVFAVSYIASVLGMYLFLKQLFPAIPAYVGALMYGFAPYRFVDLAVRGAIGEHIAFVFPPLILYGLIRIARRTDAYGFIITALSVAALLLSHNAVSIMFLPVIVGFGVYLSVYETKNAKEFLTVGTSAILLGTGLASFFLIPAFFEGKYTLRDIVTSGEFSSRFVPWQRLFISPWSYGGSSELSHALGFAQWATVAFVAVSFRSIRSRAHRLLAGTTLLVLVVVLVLMTKWSDSVWVYVSLLQKFQFPWRFLSLAVFLSALLGAIAFSSIRVNHAIFAVLATIAILASTAHMWTPKAVQVMAENRFTGAYPGTTDTGESSPIWSVRFMEKYPAAPLEVIEGSATVQQTLRTTTDHEYVVTSATESRLLENTLYFPGWDIFIDGIRTGVEFQDPSFRGLMTFRINPGEHHVAVLFRNTKLRRFADTISLIAFGIFILESTILWKRIRL